MIRLMTGEGQTLFSQFCPHQLVKQVSSCKDIVYMMVQQCASVFSLEQSRLSQTLFHFGPCLPLLVHKMSKTPRY